MKIIVSYEDTENVYEVPLSKVTKELNLTEQVITDAVTRILNRE